MEHVIRPVGAGEWEKVRELRLAALQDPVAHLAFLETYEKAVAQPDSYWQERTDKAVQGVEVRQFVAEAPDGRWVGSVTAIVERAGAPTSFVEAAEVDQVHVVGVFIRPETRGAGLAEELFRAALEWAWSLNEPRIEQVRLFVHELNTRAEALYRKVGFVPSGATAPVPGDASAKEIEMVVPRPSVS